MQSALFFPTIILLAVLKPSRADEELTLKIKEAAKYFDIRVIDHIIVSEEGYYSFSDEGIL
jgi:DNA repair protein RadC